MWLILLFMSLLSVMADMGETDGDLVARGDSAGWKFGESAD